MQDAPFVIHKTPPCKGCTERNSTCHSECDKYKEWAENQKQFLQRLKDERMKRKMFDEYLCKQLEIQKKYKNEKKG